MTNYLETIIYQVNLSNKDVKLQRSVHGMDTSLIIPIPNKCVKASTNYPMITLL